MKLELLITILFIGFAVSAWININDDHNLAKLRIRRESEDSDESASDEDSYEEIDDNDSNEDSSEENSEEDSEESKEDCDDDYDGDTTTCKTHTKQEDRRYMGSKTGYRRIVAENQHINDSWTPEGCRPRHVWTFVRHGSRYGGDDDIMLMMDYLPQLRDRILASENNKLCSVDHELLKYWDVAPDLTPSLDKNLHKEGEDESIQLGQRFAKRFPKLLGEYEDGKFRMRATYKQRAQKTGEMFLNGLWSEEVASQAKIEVVEGDDPLIRFYKFCTAWDEQVDENETAKIEVKLFEEGEEMKSVQDSLSLLLGVNITKDDLFLMHDTCRFDLMWTPNEIAPWCRIFSDEELKVLEYKKDLESYWEDGPGYNLNFDQACVLGEDMWNIFNDVINGDDSTTGTLYFSHSGATQKFLAFLQLFVDEDTLRSDNYEEMKDNRKWRTSMNVPMANNIAFVLQQCGEQDYKIGLFLNEQLVQVPGCNQDWCPMDTFINLYPQIANCDFNKICGIDDPTLDYVAEVY